MSTSVEALIQLYADRYSAHDAEGVAELCEAPFLAIRSGEAIHLADRADVRDHFASMMNAYRGQGAAQWVPITIEPHQIGDFACFATVRWNARDESGEVIRDTYTTYHLLAGGGLWRFLSYTNHF
jgi:hypothetical protein